MLKIDNFTIGISALLVAQSAIASNLTKLEEAELFRSGVFLTGEGRALTKTNIKVIESCQQISNPVSSTVKNANNKLKAQKNIERTEGKKSDSHLPHATIWWAIEQFDPFGGNLIQDWLTHPNKQQLNLTVNWQLWTVLDYFGRYRFVNQFGTVARKYGYSLNIFNQKQQCLATYQYNAVSNPPKWELHLESIGQDSLTPDAL